MIEKGQPVTIIEVCPRDGFQNIKKPIPLEAKLAVIDKLADSGAVNMEITSMVSPKAIPQMADALEVIRHVLDKRPQIRALVLVPNLKGAQRAHEAGIRSVNYVISASAAHNQANINRTHEESLADLAAIRQAFPDLEINLALATVFGCPLSGPVSLSATMSIIRRSMEFGVARVTLSDTIGVANPRQVDSIVRKTRAAFPGIELGMHMHNTHGLALANMLVGLQNGVARFETAAGGLGGCPFAPGAAGNAATEDTVNMLQRMGCQTGISLAGVLEAAEIIRTEIQPELSSFMAKARLYDEFDFNRGEDM